MRNIGQRKTIQVYFKYFLALALFGLNGIVASYILLNSYEIVLLRTFIASVFLIIVFIPSKGKIQSFKNKKHFLLLIVSGMAMGISWLFLYEAYKEIGVSIATLVYYCGPVIVMALSPIVFGEQMTKVKVLGFSIVMMGMLFLNGNVLQRNQLSYGLVYSFLSAIMYAFMVIFNKKAKNIIGIENAMFQLVAAFITVAMFMQMKQGLIIYGIMDNIIPILILGIVNTGIGCYFYFSSIQQLSAGSVAVFGYFEPLSALVFAALVLHEKLALLQIFGAIFVIGGGIFAELSKDKTYSSLKR